MGRHKTYSILIPLNIIPGHRETQLALERHIEKYFIEIGRFRNRDKKKIKRRLDKPRKMQRGKTIRADVGRQLDIERKVQR